MPLSAQSEAAAALGRLAQGALTERPEPAIAAQRRRQRRRDPREVGLNIVPLVDVTFLLMIFFVIAGSFETWEGVLPSRMPKTGARVAVPLPITPIVVFLEDAGGDPEKCVIRVNQIKNQPTSFSELTQRLREIQQQAGFDVQTPVVILSEDNVRWDHVVNGWNAAVRAGFKNLVFGRPDGSQ